MTSHADACSASAGARWLRHHLKNSARKRPGKDLAKCKVLVNMCIDFERVFKYFYR